LIQKSFSGAVIIILIATAAFFFMNPLKTNLIESKTVIDEPSPSNLALNIKPTDNAPEVKGIEATKPAVIVPVSTPKSTRSIYLGMWTQGLWDVGTNTLHPDALTNLETKIGKKVAIAHYYRGWDALDSSHIISELNTISSHGWRPMISANPYFFSKCEAKGLPLYKAIAAGNCDEFLTNIGKNLKQFGKPVFLRFAWEMNVASMEWQVERSGSSNEDFIKAWQRFHDIVYSNGGTNVLWVFAPDVGNTNYQQIYPGDKYVDWLGLDGYNWGNTQSWSKWQSFSQVYSSAYNSLTKLAPSKPLMLSEVNTTDQGGDKPAWYKDMLLNQIPNNFPRIKAVIFYNENRQAKENVNWLIDINNESLNSFSESIKSGNYVSSF
jgi:beta-mannanase